MKNYREKIYEDYIKAQFSAGKDIQNICKEYELHCAYFRKNYGKYLGDDRGIKILDAGCGTGDFLYFAKKEGFKDTVGVDISAELVDFCKSKGFNALKDDLSSYLDKCTDAFDYIIFNDVIEHLDKEEALQILCKMQKALKKNGKLIVKTPNMANPLTASAGRYIDFTHENAFTETSLKEILIAAGFNDIIVKGTDIYVLYLNPLNYLAKFFAFVMNGILYLLSYLYGRKTLKIFEKDIIAIAEKK